MRIPMLSWELPVRVGGLASMSQILPELAAVGDDDIHLDAAPPAVSVESAGGLPCTVSFVTGYPEDDFSSALYTNETCIPHAQISCHGMAPLSWFTRM